jgi:hypothetical protein
MPRQTAAAEAVDLLEAIMRASKPSFGEERRNASRKSRPLERG